MITSAAVRFIREASSPTEISSGIITFTGIFLSRCHLLLTLQAAHLLLLLLTALVAERLGALVGLLGQLLLLAALWTPFARPLRQPAYLHDHHILQVYVAGAAGINAVNLLYLCSVSAAAR